MYEPNIVELVRIKYRVLSLLPFSSLISVSTLVLYLAFRVKCIVMFYAASECLPDVLNSVLYFIAELGFFLPGFFNHVLRCLAYHGRDRAPHLRLLNQDELPRVDILITSAGEDPKMVENTAAAACAIDYPARYFRVVVLDDAGSKELSSSIQKLSKTRDNLYYTARVKGQNHHFKAGNLNHGIKHVESLPGGPAEYIGALDADMIPDPQWLRALLPHMLGSPKQALAQPPQRFYDVPTRDPLLQGLDVNFKVTEPLKETMASTWCGGSGYLLRRSALESIGGFPTESVGEDMYCSNILLGKGWDTVYVDETLQVGRVPESYKAHVTQQSRWHVGRIQTAIAMHFYLFGDKSRHMGVRQRMIGLIYVILSLCNILTTVGMATLLSSIASGQPLIVFRDDGELRVLIRLACMAILSEWLDDCVVAIVTGYRAAISEGHINYWIAPYHAAALVRAFSPKWLHSHRFEFTASGSRSETKGRPHGTGNPVQELWTNLQSSNVSFHLFYVLLLGFALARGLYFQSGQQPYDRMPSIIAQSVVVHIFWPPMFWLIVLNSFAIPLRCTFHPPSIPNRAQLLKKDPVRRANYPKEVRDTDEDLAIGSLSFCYTAIVIYVMLLGVWSLEFH